MPTGTPARAQTRAKAAAKPIKEEPVTEEVPAAEEPTTPEVTTDLHGERMDATERMIQLVAGQVTDLQAAQDSDHDAIVSVMDQLQEQGAAVNAVAENIRELAKMFGTLSGAQQSRAEVENELGLTGEHIHSAVIRIMRDVRMVGKDGQAPAKVGGYAYRKVDDIMNAVGTAMRDHGVFIRPEVVSSERKSWTSRDSLVTEVVLTMRYHWVSGVDGSSFAVVVIGEGRDNGDKATSKAQAMCYKTMLLQALCIPLEEVTGFDVEAQDTSNMAPDRQQGTAYGYGHQPANSPGGRAHAQEQAPPPPPDREARPEKPEELAARALTAARNANSLDDLEKVRAYAEKLGILHVNVENAQLQTHLLAVRGMLGNPAEPHEVPVDRDEPPWENQ
jgi:hypothetical protein